MKYLAVLLFLASPAFGQVVEPKAVTKFKVTAPLTVKPGDHIVIDASTAAGEVWFFHDEVIFPKSRATVAGKILVLSTSIPGKHIIDIGSLDDKTKERIVVTVTEGVPPEPPIPDPTPISDLKSVLAAISKLEARVAALEKKPVATGLLHDVTFVFSPQDAKAVAVNNSGELRNILKAAGVKVWVVYEAGLSSQSQKFQKVVSDNGGLPLAIMQDEDGNVIDTARMDTAAKMIEATSKHIKR